MNKKVSNEINSQINKELYSAYLYLAMAQFLENKGMPGMAKWMHEQFREEQFHAEKLIGFMNARGSKVELEIIDKPKNDWDNYLDLFEYTLKHEKFVTESINNLTSIAAKEKDFATLNFLNWFIDEQVEEEENVSNIINQVKLIGDNGYGLLMLDKELGQRVFSEPTVK